ncbi:perivitellin-2 67 kda subunit [Plakobranchus ocellatus]|uniref:Perivitellin-2 67 kDa subunit n=1 Tax=Plakobranchus ocellatus TaxID=259542 RepID=A0AAV4D449_9GAST|nr:perivitellin-2 67 kda subunit [Plakobranchus ocellatus]
MGGHHQCLIPLWLSVLTFFSMMGARFCQDKVVPQGSTTRVECTIVPPGLSKLVNGVDITMLDLTPLDFTSADGYKSPVISFTCDDGRALVKGEQRYQQPDQIWQYVDNPGGWLTTDVHLSKTYSDVRSSLTKQVGGEGAIWKFAFSASKSYSKMQRSITNATRYISEVSSYHSSSRVYMLPSWLLQLNRVAKLYIRRYIEGKTYKSDPQAYQGFINLFGTHYFSVANFGGHIRMIQETKSSYFLSHTDQDVKINAKASLAKFLSANGGRASSSTTANTQFAAASIETVSYYGGSTNLLSTNGVQNWQPTVDEKPWLFSGALKPLSNLINDDTQRSSMEQAVLQHVLRSYLVE